MDVMKALTNYAGALSLQYKVCHVDAPIKDIIDTTMSPGFLPTPSCATYIRYVRFTKFLLKKKYLLPLLRGLCEEPVPGKDFEILHFDRHVLYGSVEEDLMLLVEAADFFITNPVKVSPFQAAPFYKAAKLFLTNLIEIPDAHQYSMTSSSLFWLQSYRRCGVHRGV